jgi:hypothetical protein
MPNPLFRSANGPTLALAPASREELASEEVEPQVPRDGDAQEPLTNAYEGRRLRNGVGGEVVQLHAAVVPETAGALNPRP